MAKSLLIRNDRERPLRKDLKENGDEGRFGEESAEGWSEGGGV